MQSGLESANSFAETPSEIAEFLWSEDQKRYTENEEYFWNSKFAEHVSLAAISYPSQGAENMALSGAALEQSGRLQHPTTLLTTR